jgi:hypothetical protein
VFVKRSDISVFNSTVSGKLEFEKRRYRKAAQLYNRAVTYADSKVDTADLSLALFKRSIVLNELNDPSGALKEFQSALAYQKLSLQSNFKLGRHIKKTENSMLARSLAQEQKNQENGEDRQEEMRKRKEFSHDLFSLKSPNSNVPAVEDFVEIRVSPIKGRHLVVTKDVPMGTQTTLHFILYLHHSNFLNLL